MGLRFAAVVCAVMALSACLPDGVVSTTAANGEPAGIASTTTQPTPSSTTSTTQPTTTTSAAENTPPEVFVPPTEMSGDRTVMPVVFPDGTRADLSFPADLDLTSHGLTPYSSGQIPGFGRDFFIRYGRVGDFASEYTWEMLDTYLDSAGETVGFYQIPGDEVDYLAFQFERWVVLVYDYRLTASGPRMTDEDRAVWVENFHGSVTDEGFLVLEATPPLTLAQEGDHAGPQLSLHGSDGGLTLYLADCQSTNDPERTDDHVDWCHAATGIRVMASGTSDFMERVVSDLEIRNN